MNYELAKKLRDAGYEQHGATELYIPSLSELIEACGKPFVLHSPKSKDISEEYYQPSETEWTAYYQDDRFLKEFGSTPEEAVANLWLELNKK
jgi:hypothetical protein